MAVLATVSRQSAMTQPDDSRKAGPHDLFTDRRAGYIYRTAARMISEKGFAATSMNEIADAVELTKPGLYYYVKGKKELLYSIMGFALDRLDAEVVAPAGRISDPEVRLRLIMRSHARLLTREPGAVEDEDIAEVSAPPIAPANAAVPREWPERE